MLPPARISPTRLPRKRPDRRGGRRAGGAGPFGDRLLKHEVGCDRVFDGLLATRTVIDKRRAISMGRPPTFFTAMPSASVSPPIGAARRGSRRTWTDRARSRRRSPPCGVTAPLPRWPRPRAARRRRPARRPCRSRLVRDDFQTIVPWPRIISRHCRDGRGCAGPSENFFDQPRIPPASRLRARLRTEAPCRGDLHEGRRPRHDDGRRDTEPLGVVGDGLGMVAGRHCDDAAPVPPRVRDRNLTRAPRSLNEAVACRFSYFTRTDAPVRADSRGEGRNGVRMTDLRPAAPRRGCRRGSGPTRSGFPSRKGRVAHRASSSAAIGAK